jgi:NAD(P)-dependent dehydrogenase (short-subunit alcohol dehydrogenase family)
MTDRTFSVTGRVADKVALVAGGGSGIGRATARLLAAEGAAVAIADLDEAAAGTTAEAIRSAGGRAVPYRLDITDEPAWAEVTARLLADLGPLDVAVNSAGLAFAKPVEEMTLAEWRRVMAVNLDGVFLGTQAAIRAMRPQGRGSVVNISSSAGIKALPGAGAYCVSKAGVCMITRVAALECAQEGTQVRVNAVLPGGVKTPLWRALPNWDEIVGKAGSEEAAFRAMGKDVPLRRYAEPEEVARAVLYLASDESAYVTGAEVVIDGGFTA